MARFLAEHMSYDNAGINLILSEDVEQNGLKSLFMEGIFIQGDKKNHNERIYPVSEIRKAVDNVNAILRGGESVLGEADHPTELTVNIDRVSHMITKMWMDGPNGMGKLKIVPTPMGNIVRTLLESGVKLGVSSRGSGSVDDYGYVSDFNIVTVDIVVKPSAPNAYPRIVYESLNSKRGAVIEGLANDMVYDRKAQPELAKLLNEFITKL